MPAKCCIVGCSIRAERDNIKLYKFPQIQCKTNELNKLSKKRQQAWLKVINRKNMKSNNLKYTHVCAKHFISGRSAKIKDELNPDWVPSLHLGYNISVKVKPLARYERLLKRNKVKSYLDEGKWQSPPCTPGLSSEDTVDAVEESSPEKTREICSQTEEFYIIEGANEALIKKNQELEDRNARLIEEISALKSKNNKKNTLDDLKGNNKKVKYLTGFANFDMMEVIYMEVEKYLPISKSGKINKFDMFLLTFMKMRLDLPFSYLGCQ